MEMIKMIEIFDSATIKSTITISELFDILNKKYNGFTDVVYDTENPTNIKELWISNKIYLSYLSDKHMKIVHTNGTEVTLGASNTPAFPRSFIVNFDNGILIMNTNTFSGIRYFIITDTIDNNGNISKGIIIKPNTQANESVRVITDNMSTDTVTYPLANNDDSTYNTVLAPLYSITGDEHFPDIYYTVIGKSTDSGKIILNGQKFYMVPGIAISYTD